MCTNAELINGVGFFIYWLTFRNTVGRIVKVANSRIKQSSLNNLIMLSRGNTRIEGWIKQQYERFIFKTIGSPLFFRRIEHHQILEWLDPNENERILDVGCSRGGLILRISLKSHHTYGIDLAVKDIEWAQGFAQSLGLDCAFAVGNAEALPYPNNFFDKVICSSALEHFEKDTAALNEMSRILKPGGALILTVDSFTYPIDEEWKARHKRMFGVEHYYDRNELQTRLAASGFEMVRSKYILHSPVATYFLKKHIKHVDNFFLATASSLIAYPPVLLFEKLSDDASQGYTLLGEGRKKPLADDFTES